MICDACFYHHENIQYNDCHCEHRDEDWADALHSFICRDGFYYSAGNEECICPGYRPITKREVV